ncbi:hypothetical protein SI65_03703 [Aspergillus cristatus]|uniref:HTH CENPB-type domain-containing protein n=1 Tax=Aspergillus cristatus TaxID=573508 RepID=A0A1E3BI62_ASPCR|nr:hypothetical protein SI65_03703 [Aspergillus cristatus]
MPPKRTKSSQKSIEQEGRILFAIRHIRNGATESIREIAARFEVPKSTLLHRLNGQLSRAEARPTGHILTEDEEDSLVKWILDMDMRGAAPRPSTVQEMANILLAARGSSPPHTVGKNWSTSFTKC